MRRSLCLAVLVLVAATGTLRPLFGQIPPHGGTQAYAADLAARRVRAIEALGPDSVLVLWSAPPRVYSGDVSYEYRQESNLLYLSGIDQEETILVLIPGAKSWKEILFTRQPNPLRELWDGSSLTAAEIRERSGVAQIYHQRGTEAFDAFMEGLLSGTGYGRSSAEATDEFGPFFAALREGKARLGVLDRIATGGGADGGRYAPIPMPPVGSRGAWALEMQQRHPGVTPFSASDALRTLRQIKTPYEQRLLARSVEISAEAHIEGMKAARPGSWEYEVEAAIEYWYLKNGALSWGYPSIVGSGPNATTLHYLKSTRQMRDGDLVLVDAAANYQGMTGDITRTYPVNGKFSTEQRALYELVLRAQRAGIAAARPHAQTMEISRAVRGVFVEGLAALGLIANVSGGLSPMAQVSLWFPHAPTHGIGIDVHDPLGALDPGAAFVIEPGLYIRPDALDNLPKTPENDALIERIRPAVEKYRNIGIRIEDSFLMSETGPVVLSDKAPREMADIEKIVGTGR